MGLDATALRMIAPHLKGASVLCLSYPDIVATLDEVRSILGVEPAEFTDFGKHHKLDRALPETRHVLMLAGAVQVDFIDVRPSRGVETVIDLNQDLGWNEPYDLVIDPGTLEHCFNVGQAFVNAWEAVALGGHIVHVHPLQMINHGFWNICPTALVDFYAANGGEILEQRADDRQGAEVAIKPVERFRLTVEAVLYTKARKLALAHPVWPTQTRYKQ